MLLVLLLACVWCFQTVGGSWGSYAYELDGSESVHERQRSMATLRPVGHSTREAHERRIRLSKRYSAAHFMLRLFRELGRKPAAVDGNLHINSNKHVYSAERKHLEGKNVDTVISFFKYVHDKTWRRSHVDIKIKFDMRAHPETGQVQGGELKVYKRRPGLLRTPDMLCIISVSQLLEGNASALLETRAVHALKAGWLSFNVTRAVRGWMTKTAVNRGLLITVRTARGLVINPHRFGLVDERGHREKLPYLLSFVNSGHVLPTFSDEVLSTRRRRSTRHTTGHSTRKACRLKKFVVDFHEIGLKRIIAPRSAEVNFCKGGCLYPLSIDLTTSNHAILESLSHLVSPNTTHGPCCAPKTLEPLNIIFLDDAKNFVIKTHPEVIVTSCLCQ